MRSFLLDFVVQEYCPVIRFVMYLGASLDDAEVMARAAVAEIWHHAEQHPADRLVIADLKKSVRAIAYQKYLRPPLSMRPLPRVMARNLEKAITDQASYAGLTVGTSFVLDAIRNLEPLPRAVLAFHRDGFSVSEIAAQLGIANDLATDALNQARGTMARELVGCRVQERRKH